MAVTGTFSGTGSSSSISSSRVAVHAEFVGTATVSLQWQLNGTDWWIMTDSSGTALTFTGSFSAIVDAIPVPIRLNCSAHTNNVAYALVGF